MTDRPHDLRVEHLVDPLGVGAERPRLSWRLPAMAAVHEMASSEPRTASRSPSTAANGPIEVATARCGRCRNAT